MNFPIAPASSRLVTQSVCGTLAQLTQGIIGLGLLLVGHQHHIGVGTCALAVSADAIGMAIGRPLQGRALDRLPPARVLAGCGVTHGAAYAFIAWCAHERWAALFVMGAFVAGLALPPIATQMRADWPKGVGTDDLTRVFALIAMLQTVSLLVAPVLFTVIAAYLSATAALLAIAFIATLCTVLFGATARSVARGPHAPSRVALRRYLLLLAMAGGLGAVSGAVEVAAPALALAAGHPTVAGVLAAVTTVGTLVGGMVAMRRTSRRWSPRLVLVLGLVVQAIGSALLLVPGSIVLAALALFVIGLGFAPALAALGVLVSRRARGTAESFGWQSTAVGIGVAAGSAAAGGLVAGGAHLTAVPALVSTAATLIWCRNTDYSREIR